MAVLRSGLSQFRKCIFGVFYCQATSHSPLSALPQPSDLFPSVTNTRRVCTGPEQASAQWQFFGRDLVYFSMLHLIAVDGTYQNRFSNKWHAKVMTKRGLMSDVNHVLFASSNAMSFQEEQTATF